MKQILLLFTVILVGCGVSTKTEPVKSQLFGEDFDSKSVIPVASLVRELRTEGEKTAVVSGTVAEVCQEAGCWMKVAVAESGDTVMIRTAHAFELPKDIAGRSVQFSGTGYADTMSVEVLKHYAMDAGKAAEEIEKITAPKAGFTFEAKGVKVFE